MSQYDAFEATFKILDLIRQSYDGLTTSELGAELGITRQTALKYIHHLIRLGYDLHESDRRWYYRENSSTLRKLSHAEQALLHLLIERSHAIGANDTSVYATLRALASKFDIGLPEQNPVLNNVFEVIVEARRSSQCVEILYQGLKAGRPTLWHIKPFKLTMPVWSDAIYLLCVGSRPPATSEIYLTLKLNRILKARPLRETFSLIEQYTMHKRQRDAWSIWQSDREVIQVVLHFAGHLYRRLQESRWHASQTLEVMKNGRIKATFHIAEPREMIPWIRSWGADVVVVEPESLREAHIQELARALDHYQSNAESEPVRVRFWAKFNPATHEYHLLEAHLLDVAAVAWALWEVLPGAQRQWLAEHMQLSEDQARRWYAFLAGSHDVGKASPAFQRKAEGWQTMLERAGFAFIPPMVDPHGSATALTLAEYLKDKGMRKAHASSMAFAVGSHHGRWVGYEQAGELDENWQRAEHALLDMLWDVLGITEMPQLVQPSLISGWVAGMVSMVDWIGSQDKYFPYCPSVEDYHQYFATQCEVAAQVLGILGFYSLDTSARMRKFHEIFGFAPNDMQQAIADAAVNIGDLDTIIIEAPTGDGKTEAALYLAHQLLTQANLAGMYIAMPTRATSNQLFQRTGDFLSAGFPNRTLNYHLIHSQAEDHELYRQLAVKAAAGNEDSVVAAEWFQPRKRSLLAQFAVGTVDQAMLAVLTVKHFFVRIFALSHKVVILDEVHAYDTYMSTIQERLLGWLRALQSPIILLSATLPSVTRQRLLGEAVDDSVPYPRATLRYRSGEVRTIPLSTQRQRTLNLGWIPAETEALLNILGEQLAEGGCAAVICNTVSEAQAVYEAARAHAAFAPDEVLLFHARFPAPWRDNIEKRVVTEFGKAGPRPHRRLLVATQIIEQSLDLDFDIMVTSVAPIDMLIQRFGRLHRHTRLRPAHLQMPTALLREPLLEAETIDFGRDEFVYHRYILLQTYAWLRPLQALAVPADIEPLIERVYAAEPVLDEAWPEWFQQQTLAAYKDLRRLRDKEQFIARTNVIPAPTDSQLSITVFTDDVTSDEATGSTPSVTTRLIAPGVRIICLHRLGDHTSFDPTELRPCLLDRRPDAALVRDMLRYSVTVQHAGVRRALMQREQHEKLMQIPQLQDARIVVFEQGKARLEGGWNLRLTKELGLVIEGDQE